MADEHQRLMLAYFGDDFTGSTDALEFLTRSGVRTALFIEAPSQEKLARYGNLQAVGVAGLTRSMDPVAMEAELRPAFNRLRELGAAHVHYKVCSTFDSSPKVGSIGRAIELGAEVFKARFVPLLVGAPALGRFCVFGNLFARMGIGSAGAIHRLDRHPSMSRHPVTPADESDLRLHLARQTRLRCELFDILHLALPANQSAAALDELLGKKPDIVLFDILYASQLDRLGSLLDRHSQPGVPLFSVGSSGVEMALGAHWVKQGRLNTVEQWPDPGPAQPLLVMSGSCSPVTAGQITWAQENGFATVHLDGDAIVGGADLAEPIRKITSELKEGRSVVAYTRQGAPEPGQAALPAHVLGTALGKIARQALGEVPLKRLLIAGGDSSSYAARALGVEAVEMIAPLAPGAPLCRAFAPGSPADGCEVNFKGGQVGSPDYFGAVARGKL